jgi:hypothetical protein
MPTARRRQSTFVVTGLNWNWYTFAGVTDANKHLKWPHVCCDSEALAVLSFRHLGHYFFKPGGFADVFVTCTLYILWGCWMLTQRAVQKTGNGWGARVTAVSAVMYFTFLCSVLLYCTVLSCTLLFSATTPRLQASAFMLSGMSVRRQICSNL